MQLKFTLVSVLVATFLLSSNLHAQEAKTISSTIKEVTVFLSGAQVHREAGVSLKPGENVVKISGLTPFMDGNSVQVEGNSAYTIMSVKHQMNYLEDMSIAPEVRVKKDSLNDLQFKLKTRQSLRNVYQEEKSMVLTNKSIKGTDGTLMAEDLEEVADFFRNRLKDIEYKMLELGEEERKLQNDINRINNYLNQINANKHKQTSEILITLMANSSVNSTINLNYMVRQAGWVPLYDIRAEEVGSPIELRYKANVYQSTGNNWDKVKLTLSTGNPAVGGQAPELMTWWLNVQQANYRAKSGGYDYGFDKNAPAAMEMSDDIAFDVEEQAMSGFASNFTTMIETMVNTEFSISIPYDIPSDNQQHEVETQRITLPASFEYLAIPKLDTDAFLIADVLNWEQHNLLPGQSNIYFKGTYVGKAFIDPAITEDTLRLSLGRDKSVVVKREKMNDYCKTSTFGGKKTTEKAYKITVNNTKSKPVTITLKDNVPKSGQEDVEVSVQDVSGAKYDPETGELIWKLDLKPGEKRELIIKFSVKYPKKLVITNL